LPDLSVLTSSDVVTAGAAHAVAIVRGLSAPWTEAVAVGPAYTVSGRSGDNLALHRALADAPSGAVLVAALDGDEPAGHYGELMAIAARRAGIAGVVVDGTIRDLARIRALRFPVFFAGTAPNPASKAHRGSLGDPIVLRGTTVNRGDLMVADVDGIAVVRAGDVDEVVTRVRELQAREEKLARLIGDGRTTIEALGLEAT
jgi:4-hydroxy-4-methyl-2-oxoglutarate aldolase